ncbi:MAG: ribosome-associated translation inhibitor RaiA [Erysipelotrichaceae bacterium]|jgi:putative sigma-54 modulation protein|nr:ribosome-associated translation inhibitor RaiA [Erysipelotrichaceae bacterium]HPY79813.1 ribosome-associated translation inhibitor RaiA [Bacilli bacterium]HQA55751.1 ribosome-associated translation inhibitor RaiA [Bacilli bacterium]
MKYQIIGKNISITEGISSSVQKKLGRLDKYFSHNDEVNCRVVCSTHGEDSRVEVTIFLSQVTLRAEVEEKDLYNAIDTAVEKLVGQIHKLKTRMDRSNGRLSFAESMDIELDTKKEKKEEKDTVVRAKSYYLKPMDIEEAIARMEALGHDFFVYLDKDDDRFSVVYIRRDGGYGVIQAENPIK